MIGVIANPSDSPVVQEFFELFKTPWEFYRSGRTYDVVLCSGDADLKGQGARLVVAYSRNERPSNPGNDSAASTGKTCRMLQHKGARLPLYGGGVTFSDGSGHLLADAESKEPAIRETRSNGAAVLQVGYDLFHEVRHLLTAGQPAANASSATLDLHVALLRDLIRAADVPLVEVPAVPFGYQFIACLTHDIDHPRVRQHRLDHTMFGFLYRATLGSVIDVIQGRTSASNMLKNWVAVLKLPLVHLGLAQDFWAGFDRYLEIEDGSPSSFFAIPFAKRPGRTSDGLAPQMRGAAYGAAGIAGQLRRLTDADCEVGLHGIDAWIDSARGREELDEIRSITGEHEVGVRMHWLFFDEHSPAVLESAGASYDSTVGYNETVGYRAGTSQAYKPLNATRLLELPLHIMDTALFYPSHLHLSPGQAMTRASAIVENAAQHGGCVTVNWHDRSIAPERLWTGTYETLLKELTDKGAWFATASQAVAWFRARRSVKFEANGDGSVHAVLPDSLEQSLPGLMLRTYRGASAEAKDAALCPSLGEPVTQS